MLRCQKKGNGYLEGNLKEGEKGLFIELKERFKKSNVLTALLLDKQIYYGEVGN